MKKFKKNELAKIILKVVAVGMLLGVCMVAPNMAQLLKYVGANNGKDKQRARKAIDNLRKNKFIRTININGKECFEVTKDGKQRLLYFQLQSLKPLTARKNDKYFRIIIFDIPNKRKRVRELFVYYLKQLGFKRLQKSVFITPCECRDEIDFIKNYFQIQRNVKYILAKNVEGENYVVK